MFRATTSALAKGVSHTSLPRTLAFAVEFHSSSARMEITGAKGAVEFGMKKRTSAVLAVILYPKEASALADGSVDTPRTVTGNMGSGGGGGMQASKGEALGAKPRLKEGKLAEGTTMAAEMLSVYPARHIHTQVLTPDCLSCA